jgi:thioredoxin-like negative regulator of GroEL
MELALEELRHRYTGRAAIARVEAKQSPELAERYGVTCLPTVLVFVGGHVVRRFLGTALWFELEWAIEEWIPRGERHPPKL